MIAFNSPGQREGVLPSTGRRSAVLRRLVARDADSAAVIFPGDARRHDGPWATSRASASVARRLFSPIHSIAAGRPFGEGFRVSCGAGLELFFLFKGRIIRTRPRRSFLRYEAGAPSSLEIDHPGLGVAAQAPRSGACCALVRPSHAVNAVHAAGSHAPRNQAIPVGLKLGLGLTA